MFPSGNDQGTDLPGERATAPPFVRNSVPTMFVGSKNVQMGFKSCWIRRTQSRLESSRRTLGKPPEDGVSLARWNLPAHEEQHRAQPNRRLLDKADGQIWGKAELPLRMRRRSSSRPRGIVLARAESRAAGNATGQRVVVPHRNDSAPVGNSESTPSEASRCTPRGKSRK